MLIRHFSESMAAHEGVTPRHFDDAAIERMAELQWPGNVRELRNTVERLMILAAGDAVAAADVDMLASGGAVQGGLGGELLSAETFSDFKDRAEQAYILQRLREHDWNVAETARRIDMPRSNLYKKIEKYGLVRDE